jgi:ATP synthase subunit 6
MSFGYFFSFLFIGGVVINLMISPLEQFEIIPLFAFPFILSNSTIISFIIFYFIFFFIKINNKLIPTSWQQLFEIVFQTTYELIYINIGKTGKFFFPLIFVLFLLLLLCNLLGMIPYSFTITSHLIITFVLSLFLFIGFNIIGIRKHKLNFLNLLLPSGASIFLVPLLVPIELISYIFRVVSLPVRLFANMMAGHTLLKVIAGFAWTMVNLNFFMFIVHFIPMFLLILLVGLEIGVALIQAYVFTILICMYINDALNLH